MFVATTQAVSLSAASNVAAQVIEMYQSTHEGPRGLDFLQLGRFVLLSVMTAPPNYQWQILLEKWFPAYARTSPASENPRDGRDVEKGVAGQAESASGKSKLNMRNTLIKWFIDCMTVGALLNTVAFLVLMGLMKGQEMGMIGQNLRTVSAISCQSACERKTRGRLKLSMLIPKHRRLSPSLWIHTRSGRLHR